MVYSLYDNRALDAEFFTENHALDEKSKGYRKAIARGALWLMITVKPALRVGVESFVTKDEMDSMKKELHERLDNVLDLLDENTEISRLNEQQLQFMNGNPLPIVMISTKSSVDDYGIIDPEDSGEQRIKQSVALGRDIDVIVTDTHRNQEILENWLKQLKGVGDEVMMVLNLEDKHPLIMEKYPFLKSFPHIETSKTLEMKENHDADLMALKSFPNIETSKTLEMKENHNGDLMAHSFPRRNVVDSTIIAMIIFLIMRRRRNRHQ